MASDEEQIRQTIAKWRQATLQEDLDAVLALMTDDAIFLTPGNHPMTKADFAAAFHGFAGNVKIDAQQDVHEVRTSGDIGYAWSRIELTMTSMATHTSTQRSGDVLTIFRRSSSGEWLLARDANLLPPPQPTTNAS